MIADIFKTPAAQRAARTWQHIGRFYRSTNRPAFRSARVYNAVPSHVDLDTRARIERRAWLILDRQLADEARGRALLGLLAAGLLLTIAYALLSIAALAWAAAGVYVLAVAAWAWVQR